MVRLTKNFTILRPTKPSYFAAERVGALHIVVGSPAIAANVLDQLRCIVRWEFSSSPAYGAMLVDIILANPSLEAEWRKQISSAVGRLQALRQTLHDLLTMSLTTPGTWKFLLRDQGMFSYVSS